MSKIRAGVIGIGIMGTSIATRLLECGVELRVSDLNKDNVNAMVKLGAIACETPKDVTAGSDFIIMSLNTADIVKAVVFGKNGIAEAASSNKLLIDMSSIDPEQTKEMATKLLSEYKMPWVDCPLSGGAPAAYKGTLTVMAGGRSEDFEKSKTVMNLLCKNFTLMGPSGAGQTTKLVNQILCAITFQALAEATQLALKGGVDIEQIPSALAGGRADSKLLQEFMVKMGKHDYTPTGSLANMLKDLEAVQAFARKTQVSMPITGLVTELHRFFIAAGKGGEDNAALMKFFNGPID